MARVSYDALRRQSSEGNATHGEISEFRQDFLGEAGDDHGDDGADDAELPSQRRWTATADRLSQNLKATYRAPGFNGSFQLW